MKRTGNLFDRIVERDNLRLAVHKALRGKRDRPDARAFCEGLEDRLAWMAEALRNETFPLGMTRQFTIFDPKERRITAPCFRERDLHHAIMNVCEPVFERGLIDDTFACRKGKGRIAALERAFGFAKRFPFFLKLDVRKYFDSIPHDAALRRLARLFKDDRLMKLWERIVASYRAAPWPTLPASAGVTNDVERFDTRSCGAWTRAVESSAQWPRSAGSGRFAGVLPQATLIERQDGARHAADAGSVGHEHVGGVGLPIGSLTSQHLANFYLGAFDRFVKETLRVKGYVRYMDDSALWGASSAALASHLKACRLFLSEELGLELKPEPYINRTGHGMDFLGCRVFGSHVTLNRVVAFSGSRPRPRADHATPIRAAAPVLEPTAPARASHPNFGRFVFGMPLLS